MLLYSPSPFLLSRRWGEGMALEPSDVYGRGFLEIIRDVKAELHQNGCGAVKRSGR
jgi:hypothetical protein